MKIPKELLEEIVKESYSIAEVLRKLHEKGYKGSYVSIPKYIASFNIDNSHFTGQRWNKGKSTNEIAKHSLEDILKEGTKFKSAYLKDRLIQAGLKEWKCEKCGNEGIWCGQPLVLELHHINSNHFDNRLENLQILCPNCHSQTYGHKRRGVKKSGELLSKKIIKTCDYCHKEFVSDRQKRRFCSTECYHSFLKTSYNSVSKTEPKNFKLNKDDLIEQCENFENITELANYFNTSRTSIRNYLIKYDLYDKFKSKYNFHAKPVLQYTLDGKFIKEWPSLIDAETSLNIHSIDRAASLQKRSAGGFIWKYKEE